MYLLKKNQIIFIITSDLNHSYFIGINLVSSLSNK